MFFGRKAELEDLLSLWNKQVSSLVTCRGRRRIGKSTLIEEFARISRARFVKIEGKAPEPKQTDYDQRAFFAEQLSRYVGMDISVPATWLKAFEALDRILDDAKTVVLIDEISWLGRYDSGFAGSLKTAWDNLFRRHRRLVLVLCGSVSSWISENILNSTGFVGRRSRDYLLKELSPSECVKFWGRKADRVSSREVLDVLAVTGGVPKYLEEIDPSRSAGENIRRLCFTPSGTLFLDFEDIFAKVFGNGTQVKRAILKALADGSKTGADVAATIGVERGGGISDNLKELEEAGFVAKDVSRDPVTGRMRREACWRLCDNYMRFYLKYVEPLKDDIVSGRASFDNLELLGGWHAMMGLQFENLIVNNFREFLPKLGFSGVPVLSAAPFRGKSTARSAGVQIDLLIQARKSVCLVEIKHGERVDESVEDEVARKIDALSLKSSISVRTVLIHLGELSPAVRGSGFFDYIINADDLLRSGSS